MKKFAIFTFLLLSFLVVSVHAGPMMLLSQNESADDYSDIIFWANAEGTWNAGTSYTLGGSECTALDTDDTVCAIASAFAEEIGSPLVGSSSFTYPNGWDYCALVTTGMTLTKGRMGVKVSAQTWVANTDIISLYDNSPVNTITLDMYGSGQIRGYYRENGSGFDTVTSTSNFNTVTHVVEMAWDTTVGDGSDYVKVYVDGSLETTSGSKTLGTMTLDGFYIGNNSVNAGSTIFDQIIISTDPDRDINALMSLTSAPSGSCP